MIIADENIDHRIITSIRNLGIEVYSIYESNRGVIDEEIILFSKKPPQIILTEDKDFVEWVFAHQEKDISVIFLRYHFQNTELIIKVLEKLLQKNINQLFGKFTTVTIHKIRSREL